MHQVNLSETLPICVLLRPPSRLLGMGETLGQHPTKESHLPQPWLHAALGNRHRALLSLLCVRVLPDLLCLFRQRDDPELLRSLHRAG